MKRVDTVEYVSALRDIVRDGHEVNMLIAGNSMSPFICHERDYIYFGAPDRPLKKGDMVFYQRDNGQFVMHRIWKVKEDGFYIVGDAQTMIEGPVREDQIFARITKVKRKGKMIGEGSFWWWFFEKVWINMVPVRPLATKLYGIIYRIKK